MSNALRVRNLSRGDERCIGITLWGGTEHVLDVEQATRLASAIRETLAEAHPRPPQTDARGEREPLPTGGIVHAYPPDQMPRGLRMAQDDFGRRRTHMLDSGPVKPVDPTIAAEDPA